MTCDASSIPCQADTDTLQVLRKFAGQSGFDLCHFTCAVRRFDIPAHNIPENQRPPSDITTVMDVVQCKTAEVSAIVMNYLIDMVCPRSPLPCTHLQTRTHTRTPACTSLQPTGSDGWFVWLFQGAVERVALAKDANTGKELAHGPRYRGIIPKVFLLDGELMYQKGYSQVSSCAGAVQGLADSDHLHAMCSTLEIVPR